MRVLVQPSDGGMDSTITVMGQILFSNDVENLRMAQSLEAAISVSADLL